MSDERLTIEDAERIIPKIIEFSSINEAFERVRPITDFRKDDNEARILYLCKRVGSQKPVDRGQTNADDLYVLKCKLQVRSTVPDGLTEPAAETSEFTLAERQALKIFTDNKVPFLPHLVASTMTVQGFDGFLPRGYVAYTLMTLMPGENLWDLKFWSMSEVQHQKIRAAFLVAIKKVWQLGCQPYDCALRNIIWDEKSHTLSLVDFEHWHAIDGNTATMNEIRELQRWGLVQRPAATNHWEEWNYAESLMRPR